jgi:hypothetical protein
MELGSPEKLYDGSTSIIVNVVDNLKIEYLSRESGSHTTPPLESMDLKLYVGELAQLYEEYSRKWFAKAIFTTMFISKIQHVWDMDDKEPYRGIANEVYPIQVCQEWCPEKLIVLAREFKLQWRLVNVSYKQPKTKIKSASGSGPVEVSSEQIPLNTIESSISLKTTLRSRALRKVREARLMAAMSKCTADELTLRYYEKYGELENRDSGSVLSSDSES